MKKKKEALKDAIKNKRTENAMILISDLTYCKIYLTWELKSIAALQGKNLHLYTKNLTRVFFPEQGQ